MPSKRISEQKLKATIRTPKEVLGMETYTVVVDVTNVTKVPIDNVTVVSQVIPGIVMERREFPENVELQNLERKKRQLVKEMELQIAKAYEQKFMRSLSQADRFRLAAENLSAFALTALLSLLPSGGILRFDKVTNLLTDKLSSTAIPEWAREALSIEEWEDIERIEMDIISQEPEDSFLRKVFTINKEKLKRVIDNLQTVKTKKEQSEDTLRDTYSIMPNETISFPFKARAPLVSRARDYSLEFLVSYSDRQLDTTGTFSANQVTRFYPPSWIIGLGVVIGALGGFVVKSTFISQQLAFTPVWWWSLLGNMILALIFAFATVKTPNSNKPITAEDFIGGCIVGALAGIFSDAILVKLKVLFLAS